MPYEKEFRNIEQAHSIAVDGRRRAAVTGVTDVESFDENEVIMTTTMGALFLRGTNLRIEKLSLDTGEVTVEGTIDRFEYEDVLKSGGGFFSRLFR